jgi:hypothetical protein
MKNNSSRRGRSKRMRGGRLLIERPKRKLRTIKLLRGLRKEGKRKKGSRGRNMRRKCMTAIVLFKNHSTTPKKLLFKLLSTKPSTHKNL